MARRSYPTDLSDQEWEIIKRILEREEPYTTGRHPEVELREVWNAFFTLTKQVVSGNIDPTTSHH